MPSCFPSSRFCRQHLLKKFLAVYTFLKISFKHARLNSSKFNSSTVFSLSLAGSIKLDRNVSKVLGKMCRILCTKIKSSNLFPYLATNSLISWSQKFQDCVNRDNLNRRPLEREKICANFEQLVLNRHLKLLLECLPLIMSCIFVHDFLMKCIGDLTRYP